MWLFPFGWKLKSLRSGLVTFLVYKDSFLVHFISPFRFLPPTHIHLLVCVHAHMHVHVSPHACGGQRSGSPFSPSFSTWILNIDSRSEGLVQVPFFTRGSISLTPVPQTVSCLSACLWFRIKCFQYAEGGGGSKHRLFSNAVQKPGGPLPACESGLKSFLKKREQGWKVTQP